MLFRVVCHTNTFSMLMTDHEGNSKNDLYLEWIIQSEFIIN